MKNQTKGGWKKRAVGPNTLKFLQATELELCVEVQVILKEKEKPCLVQYALSKNVSWKKKKKTEARSVRQADRGPSGLLNSLPKFKNK